MSIAQTPTDGSAAGISAWDVPLFRRRLLAWFRRTQRDLPWRHTHDPYRIWLSEIMLQQTRVATVIPYYRRFLERFPTVRHLARARPAAVLGAWAGLGYYSRARNLHRAAQTIVTRHGGKFPDELNAALELPGIGRYTASAILSIAYDQPLAALDGNVARVLTRLGALRGDIRRPKAWQRLDAAAGALLARQAPGDWNEAMMELGATVCTPLSPRCPQCPVARWCRARALGLAEQLPAARRKARTVKVTVAAAVLLDPRGRTLLVRQLAAASDGALFSHLWQFPAVEASSGARAALSSHLASIVYSGRAASTARTRFSGRAASTARTRRRNPTRNLAALNAAMKPLPPARHTVTFRDIRLLPFLVPVRRLPSIAGAQTPRLAALDRPARRGGLAISSATRKIAAAALRAI